MSHVPGLGSGASSPPLNASQRAAPGTDSTQVQVPMSAAPAAPTARQRVAASSGKMRAVGTHDPNRAATLAHVVAPLPVSFDAPRFNPYARTGSAGASQRSNSHIQLLKAQLADRVAKAQQAMQKEKAEDEAFQANMMREDPACQGSTAAASTQEMNPDERKFVDVLINGTKSKETGRIKFAGIMRGENLLGQPNLPYTHQRNVVRNIASKKTKSYVCAHDPGLGKTATALMGYCAEACMLDRRPKMLISVPSATMDQWQDAIADWVRISSDKVMVTSKLKDVTAQVLLKKDIVVLSRDCIARAYATCYEHYQKHHQIQTGPGLRWVSQWDRKGVFEGPAAMPPLHPLFDPPHDEAKGWYGHWDLVIIDEVHYCRNPDSRWCEAHAELAHVATKRVGLTGTPVINKTQDFGGIAKALDAPRTPIDFQSRLVWCKDRNYKTVNRETVLAFTDRSLFHRATDKILNLPEIVKEAVNYDVRMPLEHVATYNGILGDARNLKLRIERAGGRATAADLQRLMALLQHMQQMIVSPLLAEHGVAKFKSEQHFFQEAARNENATGAFFALRDEIQRLRSEGHQRIVIAATHTAIMKIVRIWLMRNHVEFGRIYVYDGELSQSKRLDSKRGFLQSDNGLLFLSVGAGGVGLHLVPGCEAMIFWGSLAFSPAHLQQCLKRIHRIGQLCPITKARGHAHVAIRYLVPHGSVDGAIGKVHADKKRLMDLCVDGDGSGFGSSDDSEWRKHARIVDEAKELAADGNFPPMPETQPTPDGQGLVAFTLLPGVATRGIPEFKAAPPVPPVPMDTSGAGSSSGASAEEASAAAAQAISLDSDDDDDFVLV